MNRLAAVLRQSVDVSANSQATISPFATSHKLNPVSDPTNIVPMRRARRPFWDNVDRSAGQDACWPWLGYCKKSGHGLTSHKGSPMHASRKAWILTHGEIRSELSVLHKCDNPPCCNPGPKHMYLGTRADNMIDRFGSVAPGERKTYNRATVLNSEQLAKLWEMKKQGKKLREIADTFGVHIATVCRYVTIYRRALIEKNRTARADRLSVTSRQDV